MHDRTEPWHRFLDSKYRQGFGTGLVSPVLFCLDDRFPVINSKVVKTYRYCTEQLGEPDRIDAKLDHYLENAEKVKRLQKNLEPFGLNSLREWDIFCHYIVSKRLGGGDLTKSAKLHYAAWLFVANPEIFRWEQAFERGGVDWTRSLGSYPQKLLQRHIQVGDRAFAYQAGPDYQICGELEVAADPWKTADGTWATRLEPVKRFEDTVPLSVLKAHPVLSELKFVQTPQLSISGITSRQLEALEILVSEPEKHVEISLLDQLCKELAEAQFDTQSYETYESLVTEAFQFLGLEAEHLGGSGQPDVVVVGRLGSDTFTVVVEAKTCQRNQVVNSSRVSYSSINDYKEEHASDSTLLVAPDYAGGKIVHHATKNRVTMITTADLISILRQHDQFPFSISELERLFQPRGLATGITEELGRLHAQHQDYIRLTGTVLSIFDELQRQEEVSEPISGSTVYYVLLGSGQQDGTAPPDRRQIDHALALLSNPVLGILARQEGGYILHLTPGAARRRLLALETGLSTQD